MYLEKKKWRKHLQADNKEQLKSFSKVQQMMIIYETEPEAEHYIDNLCPGYEGKIKKKLLVKRISCMGLEFKSVSEFKQSRSSLKQHVNSFYSWSFLYRHRRSFPFH